MNRFYTWWTTDHKPEQGTIDTLAICYNRCELEQDDVYTDIEATLKSRNTLPDCVYIIGNSSQYTVFKEAWSPDSSRRDNMLKRGEKHGLDFVKQYTFLEWKENGFEVHALGLTAGTLLKDPCALLSSGVHTLLEKNNAIHQAPSGHVFKHPSGNRNKLFIQAREIASDEAELYVVSYMIALKHGAMLKGAKRIYIDTMGIYSYVKGALDLCNGKAEIFSFHSYDELKMLNPPADPYFCIVSASTSGRMAKTISGSQFDESCIATIVDVTSDGRCGDVMVALDKMGSHFPDLAVDDGTQIEIIGENFTSKAKPPRPVIIGIPHAPSALSIIHEHFGFSILPFNSKMAGFHQPKLLQIKEEDILSVFKRKPFKKWLNDEIDWSFPLTVTHVIHANDNASKYLARSIVRSLKDRLADNKKIRLISYDTLDASICKDAEGMGMVVVSSISRNGGVLREISRDLRSYIDAIVPRHFITPVGIPETSESWKQLKIFLTKNPTKRLYGFSNWIQMPIGGNSGKNTWTALAELGSKAQALPVEDLVSTLSIEASIINESLDLAAVEINHSFKNFSFLNSPQGHPLKLSEGFLFFAKDSRIAKEYAAVNQSAIYLTISSVLQSAREHKDPTKRLYPSGYESVVLGPECFLRFNDPVLQACLLRACLPSELDYSASPDLSKLMKEFLSKVFARSDKEFGDAALEFAAAIAVGSLRLARSDMDALLKEHFESATTQSALLGLLIIAARVNNYR